MKPTHHDLTALHSMNSPADLRRILSTRNSSDLINLAAARSRCALFFNADELRRRQPTFYGDEAGQIIEHFLSDEGWKGKANPLCRTAMFRGDLPPMLMEMGGTTVVIPVFVYLFVGAPDHDWSKLQHESWRGHLAMDDTCLEVSTGGDLLRLIPVLVPKGYYAANGAFRALRA